MVLIRHKLHARPERLELSGEALRIGDAHEHEVIATRSVMHERRRHETARPEDAQQGKPRRCVLGELCVLSCLCNDTLWDRQLRNLDAH